MFGAIYWWMVKLGQGIALVLGGLVLKLVGFDQNLAMQSVETMPVSVGRYNHSVTYSRTGHLGHVGI